MYVRWGSYRHELDEVGFTTDKQPITYGGVQVGVEETWTLHGFKQASSQAALLTALLALENAYGQNQQTAQILLNDGTTIARQMPGVHLLGGTEVLRGVSYVSDGMGHNGAEFVHHRTFQVVIKGRYALATPSSGQLVNFTETIAFSGGGPLFAHKESLTGLPQKQLLKRFTTYRAVQAGTATGLIVPPVPPAPLWPWALERTPEATPGNPKRTGGQGTPILIEWPLSWTYTFASAVPLLGRPHYWR